MIILPPQPDPDIEARREEVATEQQRQLEEQLRVAREAAMVAVTAMERARKIMSFPGVTSTSWAEKIKRDE